MTELLPTQGGTANQQGSILEKTVIPTFEARGFEIVKYSDWKKKPDKYGTEIFLKNVPYTTIYGHRGYTEFLAQSKRYNLNHQIQCKCQQSSGSVDEKFPYLYLNCIEAQLTRSFPTFISTVLRRCQNKILSLLLAVVA